MRKKLLLTDEQIRALHDAMRFLADRDRDRATEINRRGFNVVDTIAGHKLAEKPYLTYRDAVKAFELAYRYRRQLPGELKKIIFRKRRKKKQKTGGRK